MFVLKVAAFTFFVTIFNIYFYYIKIDEKKEAMNLKASREGVWEGWKKKTAVIKIQSQKQASKQSKTYQDMVL